MVRAVISARRTAGWPWTMAVTLCWLLAVATSAAAECAWVLWSQSIHSQGAWAPQTAYPTIAACIRDLDQREKTAREAQWSVDHRGDTDLFISHTAAGKYEGATWQCFPDTIDPHGPKRGK